MRDPLACRTCRRDAVAVIRPGDPDCRCAACGDPSADRPAAICATCGQPAAYLCGACVSTLAVARG